MYLATIQTFPHAVPRYQPTKRDEMMLDTDHEISVKLRCATWSCFHRCCWICLTSLSRNSLDATKTSCVYKRTFHCFLGSLLKRREVYLTQVHTSRRDTDPKKERGVISSQLGYVVAYGIEGWGNRGGQWIGSQSDTLESVPWWGVACCPAACAAVLLCSNLPASTSWVFQS